jgi:predicted ATP-dependent endonuclease of OLD family
MIRAIKVKNFKSLKDISIKYLSPLSVFVGDNGSGKTSLTEVIEFIENKFNKGIHYAVNKVGEGSFDKNFPVVIELMLEDNISRILDVDKDYDPNNNHCVKYTLELNFFDGIPKVTLDYFEYSTGKLDRNEIDFTVVKDIDELHDFSKKVPILIVENPENKLYPTKIKKLMNYYKTLVDNGIQVLLITYSPIVLNYVTEKNIYFFEKIYNTTSVTRVSDLEEPHEKCLWYGGIFR